MPINYKNYPPDWEQTRQRILERAENKCECCGLENYSTVYSFKQNGKVRWSSWYAPPEVKSKEVKVVLTIAHLDHDETNHDVKDDRLKAMCQLCHLRYDAKEKAKRRLEKKKPLS